MIERVGTLTAAAKAVCGDDRIAGIIGGRSDNVPAMLNREIEKKHTRFQDNYSAVVLAVD